MPLTYEVRKPLEIPGDAYNADDIATILVTGGRYGGCWALSALPVRDGEPEKTKIGEIFTERDERPSMAVDTALIWVNAACVQAGVRLAHVKNLNDSYDAESAPYFASAMFLIDRRK
jgi:hypothetical protein